MAKAEEQRHEAAQGRSADAGRGAIRSDAVVRSDEGHELADDHQAVAVGFAAAHLLVLVVGVFRKAVLAGVVDADDEERFDFAGFDGVVGVFADLPGTAGDKRCARVEEVLPVVHVENGVGAIRLFIVARRQIDDDVARLGKIDAGELTVEMQAGVGQGFVRHVLVGLLL